MTSIREAVARAMWADTDDCPERGWDGLNEVTKTIYRSNARVAIEKIRAISAEQGWHMRPDEPKGEMADYPTARVIWREMCADAPPFEWDK